MWLSRDCFARSYSAVVRGVKRRTTAMHRLADRANLRPRPLAAAELLSRGSRPVCRALNALIWRIAAGIKIDPALGCIVVRT